MRVMDELSVSLHRIYPCPSQGRAAAAALADHFSSSTRIRIPISQYDFINNERRKTNF